MSKKLLDIIKGKQQAAIEAHMPAKDAPVLSEEELSDIDSFAAALDEAFVAQRDTTRNIEADGFHPSSLGIQHGHCARRNVYMLRGEEKHGVVDPRILRVFANGHAVHDRLQSAMHTMGVEFSDEVSIDLEMPPVKGHADGILVWRDRNILIEIKSCSNDVFINRLKWKKPKDEHFDQANIYAYILKLDIVWIIYENKNTQEIKIFEKKARPEEAKKVIDDWHAQWLCFEAGELPKRPYKIGSPVCAGCDLAYMCIPDEEIGVSLKSYKEAVVELDGAN